ncbi:transcription-repair coupling factor [Propioniferax innocua]|uniref:Transcription-repair-coupling factor n=1 Tax=Propioniferax innocua TaxID=1753 RepID=A0A542ZC04_9ACTN|nr:transcription-repair coupling factor [Propioniferax innocua]TQL57886.1 transcription-repair coupling factor [Propioniferax innocua]
MSLPGLVKLVASDAVIADACASARLKHPTPTDIVLPQTLQPFVTAALSEIRPVLLVTSTYREAEQMTSTLASILGEDDVAYYPAWETLPHERLSPRSDTVGRRLEVLRRVAGKDARPAPRIVVAPIRAVIQPQAAGLCDLQPVTLATGEEHELDQLVEALAAAAYHRVDLVERRGQFAVRGGILDVFPPTADHAVRIDFFGDTIEEIRPFTVADQRSGDETIERVTADPCREILITDAVRERALAVGAEHADLAEMCERIADGQYVEGMESLSAVLCDRMELLVETLPVDTMVIIADPELARTRAEDLVRTSSEFLHASWKAAAGGGQAPIDLGSSAYRSLDDVRFTAQERGQVWWTFSQFGAGEDDASGGSDAGGENTSTVHDTSDGHNISDGHNTSDGHNHAFVVNHLRVDARPTESWRGDADAAMADITKALAEGWRVVMIAEGKGLVKRLVEVCSDHDIPSRAVAQLNRPPQPEVLTIALGEVASGFRLDGPKVAVFGSGDLSGRKTVDTRRRRMPSRRRNQVDPLELEAGDPVVHEQHGVGRYVEMIQRTTSAGTREYLIIEYAPSKRGQPGDRLFVPMDQLDQVTRYVGGEAPTLDKMGGGDWARRKSRARRAVKEIAAELIKLYAARQATKGHAFGPDNPWQRELEDSFAHVETPDQLACIEDVKRDMERVVPMDRLICGDVGYGKTEIAVRAAFKAVQDGKQVAVLVPTTILVQQHASTFAERYAGFPVRVGQLSRFQTPKEADRVKDDVAAGRIDVVVGTHRLLSGEVSFPDLGLVIIDEEQRFGVEHKEALKKLRVDVDVLSMSATPIPRTLEMAVTGIREMSTISTPPEERHPVLTFAGPYDAAQVGAAIRRELLREGQVFYIHNRVESIDRAAQRIAELVPEARVMTAHGQMGEAQLESVMLDFVERRADVLVCTTIVEAGLDISTANTLIIERADVMGLSQLHQLRGRVGRSRERGYAYFLYPPDKPLTEAAHDRLSTLAAHTDLGAGMQIAMKDLELRGAGNLLGGQQSGHIADVGFDLYIRLVGEAVTEYRDDADGVEPEVPMRIEVPTEAHLPTDYVESERLRLEMYKRLAEVRSDEDVDAVAAEMADRYGALPDPARKLLDVAHLRNAARTVGLHEIVATGRAFRFAPHDLPESRVLRLQRLYPGSVVKGDVVLVPKPSASDLGPDGDVVAWCRDVVGQIFT